MPLGWRDDPADRAFQTALQQRPLRVRGIFHFTIEHTQVHYAPAMALASPFHSSLLRKRYASRSSLALRLASHLLREAAVQALMAAWTSEEVVMASASEVPRVTPSTSLVIKRGGRAHQFLSERATKGWGPRT